MTDELVLINLSRSLQTSSIISFVISLCLILQMSKDSISKTLHGASKHGLSLARHLRHQPHKVPGH